MKKIISAVLAALLLLLTVVPVLADTMVGNFGTMYINCPNGKKLNLREKPNGKIITRLDNGTKVTLTSGYVAEKGWVAIAVDQKQNGKTVTLTGVVQSKFLQEKKPGKYEITERDDHFEDVKKPYIVTANPLNKKTTQSVGLRIKPNKTSKAYRRLEAGDELQVLATAKLWIKVLDLKTGETGYVAHDYTTFDHYIEDEAK